MMTREQTLSAAEQRLAEILAAPVVDLPQATLYARLIQSVRSLPMDETNSAYRNSWEIENVVGDLRNNYDDLNDRQILIEELARIERASDDLAILVANLRDARERQQRKVAQYSEAAE